MAIVLASLLFIFFLRTNYRTSDKSEQAFTLSLDFDASHSYTSPIPEYLHSVYKISREIPPKRQAPATFFPFNASADPRQADGPDSRPFGSLWLR